MTSCSGLFNASRGYITFSIRFIEEPEVNRVGL